MIYLEKRLKVSDNFSLNTCISGNEQSSNILIILHGGPGSGYRVLREIDVFKKLEESYLCVYFDQRGCGDSIFPPQKTITKKRLVKDVADVVKQIRNEFTNKNIFLWGGSYGGFLGFITLAEYPKLVAGYIACSPALFFEADKELIFSERITSYLKRSNLHNMPVIDQHQFMSNPKSFYQNPAILKYIFSEANTSKSLRYIARIADWFFSENIDGILRYIQIPTCIIQGKQDPICLESRIQKQIESAKNLNINYYPLDECGHDAFSDQPKEFIHIISDFTNKK